MAIFIIDQFSLSTDLPMDIRYVPSGGSYLDVSAYWYPGMQVYQTSDQTIWYADNSLNWHPISEGQDASLNELWTFVTELSNKVDINEASIGYLDSSVNFIYPLTIQHEASLGDVYSILNTIDASIIDINTKLTVIDNSILYLDSSINDIYGKLDQSDSSVSDLYDKIDVINDYQSIQDTSILDLSSDITRIDASISNMDISILSLGEYNAIQDASISAQLSEISLINSKIVSTDSSIIRIDGYNNIQDNSILQNSNDISNLESSLGLYVLKSGDTMTGDLTVPGLAVNDDLSVDGNANIIGDVGIRGNLTVDGSTVFVNTSELDVSTNFINLNTGLTGVPPSWLQSGIVVGRGSEDPYAFIFDETDNTFRIGAVSNIDASGTYLDTDTQAVATRQDNVITNGVAYWNGAEFRFDTSSGFTFNNNILRLDASLNLPGLSGGSDLMLVIKPNGDVQTQIIPDTTGFASLTYVDGSLGSRDISINYLSGRIEITDSSLLALNQRVTSVESSIGIIESYQNIQDSSISSLESRLDTTDSSVSDIYNNINRIDTSITELYSKDSENIKGAINIGDGSAGVYAGTTVDGSIQLREFIGVGAATINQNGNLIEVGIDASFGGEVNTASNIGTGEGLVVNKEGSNLPFKTISTNDPAQVLISSDSSTLYVDVSIAAVVDASMSGLSDTSINDATLETHQIVEYDASLAKWKNTNNIWWDTSVATTSDNIDGIPAGTNLEGDTLKDILYRILYAYQPLNSSLSTTPVGGILEKGIAGTQYASIDLNYLANNNDYPLATITNIELSRSDLGIVADIPVANLPSTSGLVTDPSGITDWGGTNRTVTYTLSASDSESSQPQPSSTSDVDFTFYYRQYYGIVDGQTRQEDVNSLLIKSLGSSRLEDKTDLTTTFINPGTGWIKYLYAFPDTIAIPDNFGQLSEISDQNGFNVTGSFETFLEDVVTDGGNVRYRCYLLSQKVQTSSMQITFKF